jgi:CIC family chloride channel protein
MHRRRHGNLAGYGSGGLEGIRVNREERRERLSPWLYAARYLLKWLFLALLIGTAGAFAVYLFETTLHRLYDLLSPFWTFFLPSVGGLLVGLLALLEGKVRGNGTQDYIDDVNKGLRGIPPRLVIPKFAATMLTLGTGGSGGKAGPLVAIGGGIGTLVSHIRIFPEPEDRKTAAICGAAAAISALFGAPFGGGLFAVEVTKEESIEYKEAFPALLSSVIANLVRNYLLPGPFITVRPKFYFEPTHLPLIVLTVVATGLLGLGFVSLYEISARVFDKLSRIQLWTPALGGVLTGLLGLVIGRQVLGTGEELVDLALGGSLLMRATLLLLAGKILATVFTVSSGGSGGLFFPAMLLGCMTGNLVALITGVSTPGLAQALISAAMAASLAAVLNVPVAAAILLTEVFGLPMGSPIVIGSILGFLVGRPKVIYKYM